MPLNAVLGGPLLPMQTPRSISYDPRLNAILAFAAFAVLLVGIGKLMHWNEVAVQGIAALLLAISALLGLRRFVWKRLLQVSEESLSVPSGFLRLSPVSIRWQDIQRVWVAYLPYSAILCIRTADRQVEIQDIFLPDQRVFGELIHHVESLAAERTGTLQESPSRLTNR